MADSSSFHPPLCERISYKSYVLRAMYLTILGLLFSLLLYRILHMNLNDPVWLVAFLCESFASFLWLLITNSTWSPADHRPYPDRLDERVHDLPSVDIFVTTADPVREPPIILVNTVLSLLAVNYPVNKLACYVSDDGCSPITYFSLKEASKFAKIWVPFCKKYNVKVRAPFRYFLNPLAETSVSEFTKDWEITKREYEKLSQEVEYATRDLKWDVDKDFEAFSNTKPNDHSTIVKVIWENRGGVGDENEVPHIVYISREKRPNYHHHYKAGAMNFLVRVSGLMTNAPYMLNVDCDMYVNDANVVRQGMCVFLQESVNPEQCAFVQIPQAFYDYAANLLSTVNAYIARGVAGIQGPIYTGTGCFHTRRVLYGLYPSDFEDGGSLSTIATRNILAEESLVKEFGNSKDMVKSVVRALQRIPNPQNALSNSIEEAKEVGSLHYEYQTSWGESIGWLYDSITEDLNTSIGIHSRGWTSSCISLDPPAFLGGMPLVAQEECVQWRRWLLGGLEILFNKQSPLLGMFHHKLRFRQRLVYLMSCVGGLCSIPMLLYCFLPAYSLLHNSHLFPKVLCLGTTITLVGIFCLYSLWELTSPGFSVMSWYAPFCGALCSIFDITLKLLGISKTVFIITKKTMPETKTGSGQGPSQQEDDGSLFYLPGTFILLVNLAALVHYLVSPPLRSHSDGGGGSDVEEACGCMFVTMMFLPFLKGLFVKGNNGIPLSILSKAAFLAVFFSLFSLLK